jgi:hypothetical protein
MARRRSPDDIDEKPWSTRRDRETKLAMAEDLAWLRERNPKATEAHVLRMWARSTSRRRMMRNLAEADVYAKAAEEKTAQALKELAQLRKTLASFEGKEAAAEATEKARLLRAMRTPQLAPRVAEDLRALVEAEAAGLEVPPRIPLLREARAAWGTYDQVQQALEAPA